MTSSDPELACARFIVLAAVAVAATLVASCQGTSRAAGVTGLPSRKVTAGSVEVTVTPRTLNSVVARFDVSLDARSGTLDADLAESSILTVGGRTWGHVHWKGDAPGGSHRAGSLRFDPGGPPTGPVRLVIGGLPGTAIVEWRR